MERIRWLLRRALSLPWKIARPFVASPDWRGTIVGVLALVTSAYAGYETRYFARKTATPYLFINETFASSSNRLGLTLLNVGGGSAFIDSFNVLFDGKPLSGDWSVQWAQFQRLTGTDTWTNVGAVPPHSSVPSAPTVVAEILIIVDERKYSPQSAQEWALKSKELRDVIRSHLGIRIGYHSMYGDYFRLDKTGLDEPQMQRRNLLRRYVPWTP